MAYADRLPGDFGTWNHSDSVVLRSTLGKSYRKVEVGYDSALVRILPDDIAVDGFVPVQNPGVEEVNHFILMAPVFDVVGDGYYVQSVEPGLLDTQFRRDIRIGVYCVYVKVGLEYLVTVHVRNDYFVPDCSGPHRVLEYVGVVGLMNIGLCMQAACEEKNGRNQ